VKDVDVKEGSSDHMAFIYAVNVSAKKLKIWDSKKTPEEVNVTC
jgi:hypothetical protein